MYQTMTPNEATRTLKLFIDPAHKQVITPFIVGKPGVGKSQIVKFIADGYTMDFIDMRLSQIESSDFRIPSVNKDTKTVSWLPSDALPFKNNPRFAGTSGILFLDEFNRASKSVLQAVFQLVYDRAIGDNELLDSWYIVCAGNLGFEDGCDTVDMDNALRNRFAFIQVETNDTDWLKWAEEKGINKTIIKFIKSQPKYLYHEVSKDDGVYVTPRTWELFSRLCDQHADKGIDTVIKSLGGTMLYSVTPILYEFARASQTITAREILTKYQEIKEFISDDLSKIHHLNDNLLEELTKTKFDKMKQEKVDLFSQNLHDYIADKVTDDSAFRMFLELIDFQKDFLSSYFKKFQDHKVKMNEILNDAGTLGEVTTDEKKKKKK